MAAQRESSPETSEWAGISESGDDDMDFEVGLLVDGNLTSDTSDKLLTFVRFVAACELCFRFTG